MINNDDPDYTAFVGCVSRGLLWFFLAAFAQLALVVLAVRSCSQ